MDILKGITILDFTRYFPGSFTTQRLCDWGAKVIKIESPSGDPARLQLQVDGKEGAVFRAVNRNKSSLMVNLKEEEGKKIVQDLVKEADVIFEGFRPGVMQKLGFGYEDVLKINDKIVYVSLSGYGATGPYVTLSGHDINYASISGFLDQFRDESGRPVKPTIAIADLAGTMAASEAILAGLVKRAIHNEPSYFDVSITEAIFSFMTLHATQFSLTGELNGCTDPSISYHLYETKDGRFVSLGAMEPKFWANFCNAVGHPELIEKQLTIAEPSNPAYELMCKIVAEKDFAYWCQFFEENDCCFAPVLNIEEALKVKSFVERGFVQEGWGATYLASHFMNGEKLCQGDEPYPELGNLNGKI